MWLTPGSRWRERYRGWPALRKLSYIVRTARRLGDVEPIVRIASTDITVEEMNMTVGEFFECQQPAPTPIDVTFENDLRDLFSRRRKDRQLAVDFVRTHRADLINKVEYWTGVPRPVVRALVDRITESLGPLGLTVIPGCEEVTLVELTAYTTTLTMNYLTYGRFIPRSRRRRDQAREPRTA